MIVDRVYVISEIVAKKCAKTYLEIGVREGECFLRINARKKIAVDPQMEIPFRKKRKFIFRNINNLFNRYVNLTSDDFFKNVQNYLGGNKLDVVFIDGLHTYEQSLRDVENSLKYINDDGIIIMHDCNPMTEEAAYPASSTQEGEHRNIPGFTGEWNGDVWKTVVHLRSLRSDLDVFVLDCDQGLGVITKQKATSCLAYNLEEVYNLSYKDLDRDRVRLLNLQPTNILSSFLKTL